MTTQPAEGHWTLDPSASSVRFRQKAMWGLVPVRGTFGDVRGDGEVAGDGTAHGRLEIAVESIDTGNRKRDAHLRSSDFFDAAQHPQIEVAVSRAALDGAGGAAIEGTLTVHGIVRPLTAEAEVSDLSADQATVELAIDVERGDFAMTWNRAGVMRGATAVEITVVFRRDLT